MAVLQPRLEGRMALSREYHLIGDEKCRLRNANLNIVQLGAYYALGGRSFSGGCDREQVDGAL